MDNLEIYQYRVRQINKYQSWLSFMYTVVNFYLVLVICASFYNIYWNIVTIVEVSNFELTIDFYLCLPLWLYLLVTAYNAGTYIFAILSNNFSKKWFYVMTFLIMVELIGFILLAHYLCGHYNLVAFVREHYTVTDEATNNTQWKNLSYKLYCARLTKPNIFASSSNDPEACTRHIVTFLIPIFYSLFNYVTVMFIISSPLLFAVVLNLILHFKLVLTYSVISIE